MGRLDLISFGITQLALMPNGKHQDNVLHRKVTIQRHVAGFASRDDEFPHTAFRRAADKRVSVKYSHGFPYHGNRCCRCLWVLLGEMLEYAVEVRKSALRVDQARHLFAFGRRALACRTLASR